MDSPTESDIINSHVNVTCISQGNPTPTVSMYCDDGLTTTQLPDVIVDGSFSGNLTSVTSTLKVAADNADGLKKCYCTVSAFNGSQIEMKNDSIYLLPSKSLQFNDVQYNILSTSSTYFAKCYLSKCTYKSTKHNRTELFQSWETTTYCDMVERWTNLGI